MSDFLIRGAGVAGLSVATELSARGASVTITDPNGPPGEHGCSWWAGGMLAPFCEGESAEEPVVRLGQGAADWWDRHTGQVTRNGTLVVAPDRDRADLIRFEKRTKGSEKIHATRISELEPDIGDRYRDALFFPGEAHVAPRPALAALIENLQKRGIGVSPEGKGTGRVIDCRGLAARDVLPDLRGVKGEMLVLRCPDVTLSRPVRLLHPRIPLYMVPRGDGVFMLGATMIEASERGRVTARSMLELLSAAYALHPAFGEAEILETGVDARPAFPDNLPRIREVDGVLHANGLYRHGFLLAPALAGQVADYVLDGIQPEFWS